MNPLSKLNFPTLSQMQFDDSAQPVITALDGFFATSPSATLDEVNESLNNYSRSRSGDNHNDAQFFSLHILLTYLFKRLADSVNISTVLNVDNIKQQSLKVISKLTPNEIVLTGSVDHETGHTLSMTGVVGMDERVINRGVIAQSIYEALDSEDVGACAGMLFLPSGADSLPNILELGLDTFMREYVCPVTDRSTESAIQRWNLTYNAVLNHILNSGAYERIVGGAIDEAVPATRLEVVNRMQIGGQDTTVYGERSQISLAMSGDFDASTVDYDSIYTYL